MVNRVDGPRPVTAGPERANRPAGGFGEAFQEALRGPSVRFSKHATERVREARKTIESTEVAKLEKALDLAARKGCRESLVLVGETAYIVNVPSRVVVTAIGSERLKENVFTQIDSAVIL